jgi:ketosteroid isomerase-like protein
MKLHLARPGMVIIAAFVLVSVTMFATAGHPILSTGPTVENALAADQEFAKALQNNDTLEIVRLLDKDWAVVTSHGDIAEGIDVYPSGIRSGARTVSKMELSDPRVRLFGNVAVVTTKVRLGVVSHGKPMDKEFNLRQTDTWIWKNGVWKCVLQHESDLLHP